MSSRKQVSKSPKKARRDVALERWQYFYDRCDELVAQLKTAKAMVSRLEIQYMDSFEEMMRARGKALSASAKSKKQSKEK